MKNKEMIKFRKNYAEKRKFNSTKESIDINDIDIDNI